MLRRAQIAHAPGNALVQVGPVFFDNGINIYYIGLTVKVNPAWCIRGDLSRTNSRTEQRDLFQTDFHTGVQPRAPIYGICY